MKPSYNKTQVPTLYRIFLKTDASMQEGLTSYKKPIYLRDLTRATDSAARGWHMTVFRRIFLAAR